jgi:hypothetical protein
LTKTPTVCKNKSVLRPPKTQGKIFFIQLQNVFIYDIL